LRRGGGSAKHENRQNETRGVPGVRDEEGRVRVLRCTVANFRGFDSAEVIPRGHIVLVGEPRAGRSDLLAALSKVFEVDASRVDEFDFHNSDLAKDVEIEVVVGALGHSLEQRFLDRIEYWDPSTSALIEGADDPGALPEDATSVVRLAYRARWDPDEERADQTVFWVKGRDPSTDDLRRVIRDDRAAFPFIRLTTGRPLSLSARGVLRSLLTADDAEAIATALQEMTADIEGLTTKIIGIDAVAEALEAVVATLRPYAGVDTPIADMVRFLPEDGSLWGLLRSLSPAIDLGDAVGRLPLARHGSSTIAQIMAAEVIAAAGQTDSIVVVDDFGDGLDAASAERLASLLRRKAGQVWLSTRRPEAARGFDTEELVRLTRRQAGAAGRTVHYGRVPQSRPERVAMREIQRQVLPAMTARALLIGEGPHDNAAYSALAERLDEEHGTLPPEAYGIRIIDAGGIDKVGPLAELACSLGFRVVALIDYDTDEAVAASRLAAVQSAANAVVRLAKGDAIEEALLKGVPDEEIVTALMDLGQTYSLNLPAGWQALTGAQLRSPAAAALKSNNGLHAQFVRALPVVLPPTAQQALEAAMECARGIRADAHVQL
jgi:putative ATP-dependent endonuclease of OLD family